ncbi:hypothetical protein [Mesorhizobium sp. M1295]|uniref:hypothetical protein n=1 Tax=Mesorhizobium sp. M1295 TaxID=2957076 RepID=UPI0033358F1F
MDVDLLVDSVTSSMKAEHALAFDGTGALVVPDAREIGGQRPGALCAGSSRAVGLVTAFSRRK